MIGLNAALLVAEIRGALPGQNGTVAVGVMVPPYRLQNLVQALMPLTIGGLFLWRSASAPLRPRVDAPRPA
jgi:hypothetical protein